MDADLIQQLDETIAEVFSLMLGRTPPAGQDCRWLALCATCGALEAEAARHPQETAQDHAHLTARITFTGCMRGECAVRLDFDSAAEVTEALLGLTPGELPEDERQSILADTVGELCQYGRRRLEDAAARPGFLLCPFDTSRHPADDREDRRTGRRRVASSLLPPHQHVPEPAVHGRRLAEQKQKRPGRREFLPDRRSRLCNKTTNFLLHHGLEQRRGQQARKLRIRRRVVHRHRAAV